MNTNDLYDALCHSESFPDGLSIRGEKIMFQPSFPGQVDVFLPDVEVCFRQNPVSRMQLAELLGIEADIAEEVEKGN